jgi:hypothetical protein
MWITIGVLIWIAISRACGGSWLGALNFGLCQWLGFRLAPGWNTRHAPATSAHGRWWAIEAPPIGVPVLWTVWFWILPLTGWWGVYRFIGKPRWHTAWPRERGEKALIMREEQCPSPVPEPWVDMGPRDSSEEPRR